MRLTDIVKSLFDSNGGEIYIGETRLDGIILDKDNDTLTASTIASNLDSSGLRISVEKNTPFIGGSTRLVATAKIEFDSYRWEIDGTASFVGDISTGSMVYIEDQVLSNNIITLIATKGTDERRVQVPIDFIQGFFSDVRISGVSAIDTTDPVRYVLISDTTPDSIVWSVIGDAIISTNGSECFVIVGESGEDINLSVSITKTGFNDEIVNLPINVSKCEIASGSEVVERPYIIGADSWDIGEQGDVSISDFKGQNISSSVLYEIGDDSEIMGIPIVEGEVTFNSTIAVDISTLLNDTKYIIRIRYKDNLGNLSKWSDASRFSMPVTIEPKKSVDDLLYRLSHHYIFDTTSPIDRASSVNTVSSNVAVVTEGDEGQDVVDITATGAYASASVGPVNTNATIHMKVKFINSTDSRMDIFSWGASGETVSTNYNEWKADYHSATQRKITYFTETGAGINGSSRDFSTYIDVDKWVTLTFVFQDSNVKIYLDGIKTYDGSFDKSDTTVQTMFIGNGYTGTYTGRLLVEEFCIWKGRILNDEEVLRWSTTKVLDRYSDSVYKGITNYWAMNTQNPLDLVGSNNMTGIYGELIPGGYFDNEIQFNGSTALYTIDDVWSGNDKFTLSATVTPNDITNVDSCIVYSGTGPNEFGLFMTNDKYSVQYRGDKYDLTPLAAVGERVVFTISVSNASASVYMNTILVQTINMSAGLIVNDTTFIRLGGYDGNGRKFNGKIEEVAFWDGYALTYSDIQRWATKTERPFNIVQKYSLPCEAIDKPVILSDIGSRIKMTRYLGDNPYAYTEYQIFNDYELKFSNAPLLRELLTDGKEVKIANSIASNTYKVRARYIDVAANKSLWSRPHIMNIYFIPVSVVDFLLVDSKDSVGLTNVTQTGLPEVANGYCQFDGGEYFSFDRVTFDSGAISFWVKFDDLDPGSGGLHTMIMGGDNGTNKSYLWFNVSNNQIRLVDEFESELLYSSTFSTPVGEWHHIVVTMDQYESKIYIDMMEIGTGLSAPFLIDNLGAGYIGGTYDFKGGLKGFRKFDTLITHDERLDLFQEYD